MLTNAEKTKINLNFSVYNCTDTKTVKILVTLFFVVKKIRFLQKSRNISREFRANRRYYFKEKLIIIIRYFVFFWTSSASEKFYETGKKNLRIDTVDTGTT